MRGVALNVKEPERFIKIGCMYAFCLMLSLFVGYSISRASQGDQFYSLMVASSVGPVLGVFGVYLVAIYQISHKEESERTENLRIYFREFYIDLSAVKKLLGLIEARNIDDSDVSQFKLRSRTPTAFSDKSFMRGLPHEIQTHIFIIEQARLEVMSSLYIYEEDKKRSSFEIKHNVNIKDSLRIIYDLAPSLKVMLKYMEEQIPYIDDSAV